MPDDPDSEPPQRRTFRARLARLIAGAPAEADRIPPPSDTPDASPRALRLRIGEFEDAVVGDVMMSRAEIAAVDVSATMQDVLALFAENAHSRMPVYRTSLDEPLGFVHIKDVVAELTLHGVSEQTLSSQPLDKLRRDILFVPASMRLPDLLVEMQTSRIHIALVVDEYGGIDGVVCLEDLVEQIVGDIEDEHDDAPPPIHRKSRNVWEADALADIGAAERATGLPLAVPEFEEDIETLGGLAFALSGRVPQAGEIVEHPLGHRLEIVAADPRRVTRLRIRAAAGVKRDAARAKAEAEAAAAAAASVPGPGETLDAVGEKS